MSPRDTDAPAAEPADVLAFWFDEHGPADWFKRSDAFDAAVRARLGPAFEDAATGKLDGWVATPEGALALILLLDQVPRNLFRDDARAFATDAKARDVARAAVEAGHDLALSAPDRRLFVYLPFEHSEDAEDQALCVALSEERLGNDDYAEYARRHKAVIDRFGRFPHRNACLGRETTAEEAAFLKETPTGF